MNKSAIAHMPQYFDRYIALADDVPIVQALEQYGAAYLEQEKDKLVALGDSVYAPGKWTVKDILQHMIDTERIFAYRALRIGRSDKTPLPGFEEDFYASHTTAAKRSVDELLEEYAVVRQATILLFRSFSDQMLQNEGTSSGTAISALAIGFTIAGHVIHHVNVLRERYYPLLVK
jgi:hypothetical protein